MQSARAQRVWFRSRSISTSHASSHLLLLNRVLHDIIETRIHVLVIRRRKKGEGMVDAKASESAANTQGHRQIHPLHPTSLLAMPKIAAWNGLDIEYHLQPP